ncbi:TetR/AcrR family transcriptional regulator [Methyloligella sp. GL2]|nr:TetR/AcrR family transcriptional regulator [Methyloligella sp. GL2]
MAERKTARDDNTLRIVEAASELFATQGYAATSVEQVAAKCSAGKDTIYRRFPSKLALFGAVLEQARDSRVTLLAGFTAALPKDGSPLGRLQQVARWFLDANLDPELVAFKRIAMTESQVLASGPQPGSQKDPFMEVLVSHVEAAQEAGAIAPGDSLFIALQLVHCIVAVPLNDALVGGESYAGKAARDAHFKAAWALFLEGAAA